MIKVIIILDITIHIEKERFDYDSKYFINFY